MDSGRDVTGWVASRVPAWLVDLVVVGLGLLGSGAMSLDGWPPRRTLEFAAVVALNAVALLLFWRRRFPEVLFVVAVLTNILYMYVVRDKEFYNTDLAMSFAGYALGAFGRSRYRWLLPLLAVVPVAAAIRWVGEEDATWAILGGLITVGGPWLIGDSVRGRRRLVAGLRERTARLEAERLLEAERAVSDERSRIARELHDVVAHHVSVMGVQAGAARLALDQDPDRVRRALSAIESTSRQAVGEMRRMLGVLRSPSDETAVVPDRKVGSPDAPQPGLDDLPALIQHFRSAGVPLQYRVDRRHSPAHTPAEIVQLSVYRIVEQSLTNVLEHAGAATTFVLVRVDDDVVDITVQNDPPDPERTVSAFVRTGERGRGSVGMRERVALFSGSLDSGPLPDGGYRVRARLATAA